MHLFHRFRYIRVLIQDVLRHDLDHFTPRAGRQLLIAVSTKLPASHSFHGVRSKGKASKNPRDNQGYIAGIALLGGWGTV